MRRLLLELILIFLEESLIFDGDGDCNKGVCEKGGLWYLIGRKGVVWERLLVV